MKVFHSSYNLYNHSKNEILFRQELIQNTCYISNKLYQDLLSRKIKEKSHIIYKKIKENGIKIIPIYSKNYIRNLEKMYDPPFALFVKGDFSILENMNKKKKVFIYKNKKFSEYGNKIYDSINSYILTKDCFSIHILDCKNKCNFIEMIKVTNKKSDISFIDICDNENQNIKNKYNSIIAGISDIMVIPEASFNIEINNMVEIYLELGKDILVIPGNIYSNTSYFSNILIKEGAEVILKNSDLDIYL